MLDIAQPEPPRIFLFLQGHPSRFGYELANELERRGQKILHISLCAGDRLFWRGRPSLSYRGRLRHWPTFLGNFLGTHGVTDILCYGDQRPYHRIAIEVANIRDLRAFVYEFGYMRPDWITLERNGMGAFSHFPTDPAQIRRIAQDFAPPDLTHRYSYSKTTELNHEIAYHFSSYLLSFLYPFYDADRYYNLLLEYISGIPGLFTSRRDEYAAQRLTEWLIGAGVPFFLQPLQLQNDYQLRRNAPFPHQRNAIEKVVRSFAAFAPAGTHLVLKQHPLDNGWEGWQRITHSLATDAGVGERVHFIIGGDLDRLLSKARGCVLINSTVGVHALRAGCPVKVLGNALFDITGLCDQRPLDRFWDGMAKPDPVLTDAFLRALAGTIQVKGNFFSKEGRAAAIPVFVDRLMNDGVNGAGAFVDPPPRVSSARSQNRAG